MYSRGKFGFVLTFKCDSFVKHVIDSHLVKSSHVESLKPSMCVIGMREGQKHLYDNVESVDIAQE